MTVPGSDGGTALSSSDISAFDKDDYHRSGNHICRDTHLNLSETSILEDAFATNVIATDSSLESSQADGEINRCSFNADDMCEVRYEGGKTVQSFPAFPIISRSTRKWNNSIRDIGSDVILHVYDLTPWTRASQLPFFHLGVQVYRLEYFFCCLGIQSCAPTQNTGHVFKESVFLGRTSFGLREVLRALRELGTEWTADTYNLLGHNCQSFVVAFCRLLGLGDPVPKQYSRFSGIADLPSALSGILAGAATLLTAQPFLNCIAPDSFLQHCSFSEEGAPNENTVEIVPEPCTPDNFVQEASIDFEPISDLPSFEKLHCFQGRFREDSGMM